MKDNIESELLAALLGKLDALFEPQPLNEYGPAYQARWQRRDKYLGRYEWTGAGLLPWSNPGEDQAEKKRYSRAMAALKDQGLVRMEGRAAGLTAEGLTVARPLVGQLQLEDCLPGLDVLLNFIGTGHEWIGNVSGGWVSESSMAGYDPIPLGKVGQSSLPDSGFWVISALLPLAIAGLIDHDFWNNCIPLYYLTKEGRTLAKERRDNKKANPKAWPKLKNWVKGKKRIPLMTEAACEAWQSAKESATAALESAKPININIIKTNHRSGVYPVSMQLSDEELDRLDAEADKAEAKKEGEE